MGRTIRSTAGAALICAAALASSKAYAGAFYVPEQGARAIGMGGATVAAPGEASGIFHNPASIAGAGLVNAEVAGVAVFPHFTFFRRPTTDPFGAPGNEIDFAASKNTNTAAVVPFVAATTNLGIEDLGVGLGVYVPFGSELEFPADGAQRNVVTRISLRAIHITPTVAYRFWKRLRVGVGVSFIHSSFALEQRNASPFVLGRPDDFPNPDPSTEGDTKIDASDSLRLGATFGAMYTDPDERFSVGASFMMPTKLNFRGTVNVTNSASAIVAMNDAQGNPLPAGSRTDNVALSIPLPAIARLGVRVHPIARVAVELDVNYQAWSTTRKETIFFEHNYPLLPQPGAQMNDITLDQSYRDTISVRLGGEVAPFESEAIPLKLRGGVLYDQSPIDDRHFDLLTPDSDKWGVSLGAGYAFDLSPRMKLGLDLAYMHLFYAERNIGPAAVGTDAAQSQAIPGSDRTILNKPAASFFYGVTRAGIDLLALGVTLRI